MIQVILNNAGSYHFLSTYNEAGTVFSAFWVLTHLIFPQAYVVPHYYLIIVIHHYHGQVDWGMEKLSDTGRGQYSWAPTLYQSTQTVVTWVTRTSHHWEPVKIPVLGLISDLLNQNLCGWGPAFFVWTRLVHDSVALLHLKSPAQHYKHVMRRDSTFRRIWMVGKREKCSRCEEPYLSSKEDGLRCTGIREKGGHEAGSSMIKLCSLGWDLWH